MTKNNPCYSRFRDYLKGGLYQKHDFLEVLDTTFLIESNKPTSFMCSTLKTAFDKIVTDIHSDNLCLKTFLKMSIVTIISHDDFSHVGLNNMGKWLDGRIPQKRYVPVILRGRHNAKGE